MIPSKESHSKTANFHNFQMLLAFWEGKIDKGSALPIWLLISVDHQNRLTRITFNAYQRQTSLGNPNSRMLMTRNTLIYDMCMENEILGERMVAKAIRCCDARIGMMHLLLQERCTKWRRREDRWRRTVVDTRNRAGERKMNERWLSYMT